MPTPQEILQVKGFARQDALLLAALWLASFAFIVMAPQSLFGSLLALATPFVLAWLLRRFRDRVRDGVISFRRGYFYCVHCFVDASLIFALAQYVYFRFIDGGRFVQMISESVKILEPVYQQNGIQMESLRQATEQMSQLPPSQWVFTLLMQNVFIGFILSIPIALIVKN